MSVHTPDAGNVGIYGSALGGVVTTTGGVTGWINENAVVIGLGLSLLSLFVGVVFKIISESRSKSQAERHHQEVLQLQREQIKLELEQNAQAHEALRIELLDAVKAKIE